MKIKLTIPSNFISSIDNDEERLIHSKIHNIEIMIKMKQMGLLKNFLIHLKTDIKIIWNRWKVVRLSVIMVFIILYCHKLNLNHGGSCIDSSDWIKK